MKIFVLFLVIAFSFQGVSAAETLFEDDFSSGHPLLSLSFPPGPKWTADYLKEPTSDNVMEDVTVKKRLVLTSLDDGRYVQLKDHVALIANINTKGFENIELKYCRKTEGLILS